MGVLKCILKRALGNIDLQTCWKSSYQLIAETLKTFASGNTSIYKTPVLRNYRWTVLLIVFTLSDDVWAYLKMSGRNTKFCCARGYHLLRIPSSLSELKNDWVYIIFSAGHTMYTTSKSSAEGTRHTDNISPLLDNQTRHPIQLRYHDLERHRNRISIRSVLSGLRGCFPRCAMTFLSQKVAPAANVPMCSEILSDERDTIAVIFRDGAVPPSLHWTLEPRWLIELLAPLSFSAKSSTKGAPLDLNASLWCGRWS